VRCTGGVGHCRELVPVGVDPFLAWVLCAHYAPDSGALRGEVVNVSEVAGLFPRKRCVFCEEAGWEGFGEGT
jgi:hypothetical protein